MTTSRLPLWEPSTDVLTGYRITPDPAALVMGRITNWVATTDGTTGLVQPTWPSADPWTVVDGTVTWALASSFRQNIVAALLSTLTDFRTANPTLLKGIAAARPANLTKLDMPGAYIGSRDETVLHTGALRTRQMTGLTVVVVDIAADNAETETRLDVLTDALQDVFTAAFHATSGFSITQQGGVAEIQLDDGPVPYVGNVFSFAPSFIIEGRE